MNLTFSFSSLQCPLFHLLEVTTFSYSFVYLFAYLLEMGPHCVSQTGLGLLALLPVDPQSEVPAFLMFQSVYFHWLTVSKFYDFSLILKQTNKQINRKTPTKQILVVQWDSPSCTYFKTTIILSVILVAIVSVFWVQSLSLLGYFW